MTSPRHIYMYFFRPSCDGSKKTIWYGAMDEKSWQKKLEFLKKRLKSKFVKMAEPMRQIEYTRENYEKLFPNNKVITPLGEVKLGMHQFEKLNIKSRENLLGAMCQTLSDPIIVINEDDKKSQLYSKSFINDDKKIISVLTVIANIDGNSVAISTHKRNINNIINKIKKPADLLYERQISGIMGTAGHDPYSLNLANKSDTQSEGNQKNTPVD